MQSFVVWRSLSKPGSLMVAEAFFGLSARPPTKQVKRFPTSVPIVFHQNSKKRETRHVNIETTILRGIIGILALHLSLQQYRVHSRSLSSCPLGRHIAGSNEVRRRARKRFYTGNTATRRHVEQQSTNTKALQSLSRDQFDHKRGRCYGFANVACSLSLTESGSGREAWLDTAQHIHAAHATSKAFTSSSQQHHPWNCTCICTGSRGRPRCDVTPDQRLHLACILDFFCRMMLTVMRKRCVVAGDALLHFDFIRQQKDPMGGSVSVPNQSCFA